MSDVVKLYYAFGTCALASHIALIEAGAAYELVRLSFKNNEQNEPGYLKVNPKARVPALVTAQGVLTETPAILAYIAQRFPRARLAPLDDPFAFARVQAFNSFLCSTVHIAHAHRMRGYRWVDRSDSEAIKAMQRKVPESVGEAFGQIEDEMGNGPWVMGEHYTICDPYLFTLSQWLESDGVDITRLPKVHAFRSRMAERPAVRRAIEEETRRPAAAE